MGFLSGLLGGGKTKSKTETSSTRAPYAPAIPGLEQVGTMASDIMGKPLSFFGDTYTPYNEIQEQSLQGQLQNAYGAMPGVTNPALGAYQRTLNASDLASNPYYQNASDALARNVQQGLELNIMPAIRTETTAAGQEGGGSRDAIARGVAGGLASQGLANAQAGLALDAYGQGLAQERFGMGYAPQALNLVQAPQQAAWQVGQAYQNQDEMARAGREAGHYFRQDEPYMRATRGMSLLGPLGQMGGTEDSTSTTTTKKPGMSPLQAMMGVGSMFMGGGGLGGLGGLGSLFGGGGGGSPITPFYTGQMSGRPPVVDAWGATHGYGGI
jgi:hypothetical protein